MRQLLIAAALSSSLLATSACVPLAGSDSAAANAIPTADQAKINLPDNEPRTIGQLAQWYVVTRDATIMLNGGSAWVLTLVHTIVEFPVTSKSGNVDAWGPWSSDALDPAQYKLNVTANSDGSYDWNLDGRPKTSADATFVTIINGHSIPSDPIGQGNGNFTIDFDAAKVVDPIDNANSNGGTITADYDLAARTLAITAETTRDDNGTEVPVTMDYDYAANVDGSGKMTLGFHGDVDGNGASEDAAIRSRWLATGAGRADLLLTNGDLPAPATASECWNSNFGRTYYSDSVNYQPTEGDPTACVFADQDLPPAN